MDFEENYQNNIETILTYRDLYSGTHGIDQERAEEWINKQISPLRRRIARLFIENINYFTFNQVFEYLRDAIIKMYNMIPISTKIYMLVSSSIEGKNNSSYIFSMVALYLIRTMKLREPIPFILDNVKSVDGVVVIFDDCIYSGGQTVVRYKNLREEGYKGIVYSCSAIISKLVLGRKDYNYYKGWIIDEAINNLEFVYGYAVSRLFNKVGVANYAAIRYYFSPNTGGLSPSAIIYFDHKIADQVSTFQRVLLTGPIIPRDTGYTDNIFPLEDTIIGELSNYSVNRSIIDSVRETLWDILDSSSKGPSGMTLYHPFIKGCTDISFPSIPYKDLVLVTSDKSEYKKEIDEIDKAKNRCPESFYKKLF